jgi:hypothetical protein
MRRIPRNIAISLALCALAVTGVASTAEAKGGGNLAAAAAMMSRGAQIRVNRMKVKMALRTRGFQQQKTRRQLRLGKRKLQRAMSRREIGVRTSETDRTRARFAGNIDDAADYGPGPDKMNEHPGGIGNDDVSPETLEEVSGRKRSKTRRERVRKATTPPTKKIPKRRRGD